MGRPPSNGGPAFRFNANEVAEMETILHEHNTQVPTREVLQALADKFSNTVERSGKVEVQMKQVWNWFQNRRYAIRARAAKTPMKLHVSSTPREVPTAVRNVSQVPQSVNLPAGGITTVQSAGGTPPDNTQMEFEAKSARDGAWYDVTSFLSHKSLETGDPFVLVRFAGFGPEEDEWVNVRKHVRQRSLPCEAAECVAVLAGDLILCFQEGKEQALYYDAHVLDAQRRRHDIRGCRCRFLVRYDHDQSEEIVPLKKVCRRPETDHRLQQLHAMKEPVPVKTNLDPHSGNTLRVYPPSEPIQKLQKIEEQTGVAPVRLPTYQPQNASVCSGGKVETVVGLPSNMAVPSSGAAAADTLTTTNAETSTTLKANADPNIGGTTSSVPTVNAETSLETQTNSVMNIDATTVDEETCVAPQADSAMDVVDATTSTVDTAVAEASDVPPVNAAATTTSTVHTGNAETNVVPTSSVAPDTLEPCVAAPTSVGDTTADISSDQNVLQGQE